MCAFDKGYNAGIDVVFDKIKNWDGVSRNSYLYELLYLKKQTK